MREAGILLPLASLPNEFGIGDFGGSAYQFIDCIAAGRSADLADSSVKSSLVMEILPISRFPPMQEMIFIFH